MRHTKIALALLTAAVLSACGGGATDTSPRAGDQTLKTKFSNQVSFGDSLSDVGTYAVGAVKQMGGGQFTINGDNTAKEPTMTGKNWTQVLAAQLGVPAPCPAQTGLDGDASKGFSVPIVKHANCFNYAQGGSRVTHPVGSGHKLAGSPLGQTTVPAVTQVANHLAVSGGKFSGTELVTVMTGGNDILMQMGQLGAAATAAGKTAGDAAGKTAFATSLTMQLAAGATNPQAAAQAIGAAIQAEAAKGSSTEVIVGVAVTVAVQQGNTAAASPTVYGPMVAKAQSDATAAGQTAGAKAGADYFAANASKVVSEMAKAGAELVALVKGEIVGKGANYVVVNNLPDVASTPAGQAQSADARALIDTAVKAFNDQLRNGLGNEAKVLLVDLYTVSKDQVVNPAPYGLTNTKSVACGANPLGHTSLACNGTNLNAGDVSHYMFADEIHPTPFVYSLVAKYVAQQMMVKGWL